MTNITISKTDNYYDISIKHHADSIDACAAVSVLIFTLYGSLLNNKTVFQKTNIDFGDTCLAFESQDPMSEEDVRMATIGFLQLEASYPEQIDVQQNIFIQNRV